MKKQNYLTLLLIAVFQFSTIAQSTDVVISKKDYVLYGVKEGKKVKPEDIITEMKNYDVLFFGEEHDDSIGHQLQLLLFKEMFNQFGDKAVISMEMFDRDVQYIMDEYLAGTIKKSYFLKDSRKWSNYKDYEPMVEFAKENGLAVVCANAPFRYVSVATSKGLPGLQSLSEYAKKAIAPLPYNYASGDYKAKLDALMGHDPNDSTSKPMYDMVPGQSLWDATMAYSVFETHKARPDSKILHLNGRFHTDEKFGIIQRLYEYNPEIRVLTISLDGHAEDFPKIKFEDFQKNGDYLIFTDPTIPKSYE